MVLCSCCGKKKKLLDMFYSAGNGTVRFCSDCWDVNRGSSSRETDVSTGMRKSGLRNGLPHVSRPKS